MAYKDPVKQRAYYAQWLAANGDKNNLVRRTRYKHDPVYRERVKQLRRESAARTKAATSTNQSGVPS